MPEESIPEPPRPHPHPGLFLALEGPDGGARRPRPRGCRPGCAATDSTWFRAAIQAAPRWATGCGRSCSIATPSTCRSGPKC